VITKIRAKVDAAIDKVIAWIVKMGKALFDKMKKTLGNWWKKKKPFKADDGDSHTLLFQGEGKSAKLIIRSDPEPYTPFIQKLNTKADKSNALKTAGDLDEKIKTFAAAEASTAPNATATNPDETIQKLLDTLSTQTAALFPKTEKSSPPIWGPLVLGSGSSMRIDRLTKIPPEGGSKTSEIPGPQWNSLILRRGAAKRYYVQGHLLHDAFGGPGSEWKNLAPISEATNKQSSGSMFWQVEQKMIQAFAKKNTGKKLVISYNVTASYGYAGDEARADSEEAKDLFTDAERADLKKVLLAERAVPKSLSCVATKVEGEGFDSISTSIANPIDQRLSSYRIGDASKKFARVVVDINGNDYSKLNTVSGLITSLQDERAKGTFKNKKDLETRIGLPFYHVIMNTPGIKLKF